MGREQGKFSRLLILRACEYWLPGPLVLSEVMSLKRRLRAGHSVRAMVHYNSQGSIGNLIEVARAVRDECEILPLDIQDQEAMYHVTKGFDAIFHLAALIGIPYSYVASSSYVSVNVNGTLNMLNAARRHEVSFFVHTSTSEVLLNGAVCADR